MNKSHVSRSFLGAALAAFISLAGVAGCGDGTQTTTLNGGNCADACARYAVCYNASYDTVACTNRCETALANSSITVTVTDDCLNCIGATVCSAATYACDADCNAFITVP